MNALDLRAPAGLMFLILACASAGAPQAAPASCPAVAANGGSRAALVAVKAKLMSADYRADLDELERGRQQARACATDPAVAYLAHYWSAYASWRAAINGSSRGMSRADLIANLQKARADFEQSIAEKSDFADAQAAASSVNAWLGTFFMSDRDVALAHYERSQRMLARALELEPENPRVLWVQGGDFLFRPVSMGGDPEHAIRIYRHAIEVAPMPDGASPLPDWGKPEALMAMAYAKIVVPKPEPAAAIADAREALRMVPDWSYVRDVLVPQIEAKAAESRAHAQ